MGVGEVRVSVVVFGWVGFEDMVDVGFVFDLRLMRAERILLCDMGPSILLRF